MCTTSHTVRTPVLQAREVSVNHSQSLAVQYDLYFPAAIWDTSPVQTFLNRLLHLVPNATVFNSLTGVWRGDEEEIRIYRLIIRTAQFNRMNVRTTFQNEIGRLMAELSITALPQEAVLFTETDILMSLSEITLLE